MDKGQHLRLLINDTTDKVIALATEMTLHLSANTEDSTTKDTTDGWQENQVVSRQGDIQFIGLIGIDDDANAINLTEVLANVSDTPISWKLAVTSGTNNRTIGDVICSGQGKIVNVNPQGENRQNARYSGTINVYGPVTVGSSAANTPASVESEGANENAGGITP